MVIGPIVEIIRALQDDPKTDQDDLFRVESECLSFWIGAKGFA
jgi:hypothetical protein